MWGEPSFADVAATLDLIESLRPRCIIPGHGRVFDQVGDALSIAHSRLDAFIQAPARHARHALKVLIKFKLLDARRIARSDLDIWLARATYLEQMRRRFAPGTALQEWCAELLMELVRSGAARIESDFVFDV